MDRTTRMRTCNATTASYTERVIAFASSGLMRRVCTAGTGVATAGWTGLTAAEPANKPPAVAVSADRRDTSCSCMSLCCRTPVTQL